MRGKGREMKRVLLVVLALFAVQGFFVVVADIALAVNAGGVTADNISWPNTSYNKSEATFSVHSLPGTSGGDLL
jgi:hypothetical protein